MTKIEKYLKIGSKLKKLPKEQRIQVREAVLSDEEFLEYVKNKKDWTYDEHDALVSLMDFEQVESGFYHDKYNKRISYNGIKTLKKAGTELDLNELHKIELDKCRDDFKYFRKYYVKIQTRQGLKRPDPREYQERLEDALLSLDDVAVSFSRQSGKTITTASYLGWRANFHPQKINIGIVANRPKTAREVLTKIKQILLELPIWMLQNIETWNKSDIELADTNSRILTDSPSADSFRGDTVALLFVDETAYIKRDIFEEMLDSIIPTMSSLTFKQLIYTSTANGVNHWSRIVEQSRAGVSGMTLVENDWRDVPHYDKNGNLLSPEEYKRITIRKYGEKFFKQTEENEFLGSSNTLIAGDAIRAIEERVEQVQHKERILHGLKMYKDVQKGHSYIVTVDGAKDGKDDFAINVVDISQFPFEQVAVANLQIDYITMPEHIDTLGRYYNEALIIVENNEGAGQSITDTLYNVYEYENLFRDKNINKPGFKKYTGFRTTSKSRDVILKLFKLFVEENKLLINSEETLKQLYTFTLNKQGKYQAEDGYKDDAIMSLAIVFAPFMENKTYDDYKLFVKEIKQENSTARTVDFLSALDIGSSDDGVYDPEEVQREEMLKEIRASAGLPDFGIPVDISQD